MQTKEFHLRDLLAVITGLSLGGKYFNGLQGIHDFLEKGDLANKRGNLLKQFPQLADCEKDFTPEELKILKDNDDKPKIERILEAWISRQTSKYGEKFVVASIA